MPPRPTRLAPLLATLWLALHPASAGAEPDHDPLVRWAQGLEIGAGWGRGLPIGPGRNSDLEKSRFVSLHPRWRIQLSDAFGDGHWYRGSFQASLVADLLRQYEPRSGNSAGASLLLGYGLHAPGRSWSPYLELGAGMNWFEFDLDRQDDGFNFTLVGEVGVQWFLTPRSALVTGWRFHHVSNAGTRDPNSGYDASVIMIGFRVRPPWQREPSR